MNLPTTPAGPWASANPHPAAPAALDAVQDQIQKLAALLRSRAEFLATAESCTGGLIAAACTALAGSSDWFDGGIVSYSNAAKTALLGVGAGIIQAEGAVSRAVAEAMAMGLLIQGRAHWAVAVTGIAGPGGAVPGKPVGTVCLAWGRPGQIHSERQHFLGDRQAVREQSVLRALQLLVQAIEAA